MADGSNSFGLLLTADRAGVGHHAVFGAGGSGSQFALAPSVGAGSLGIFRLLRIFGSLSAFQFTEGEGVDVSLACIHAIAGEDILVELNVLSLGAIVQEVCQTNELTAFSIFQNKFAVVVLGCGEAHVGAVAEQVLAVSHLEGGNAVNSLRLEESNIGCISAQLVAVQGSSSGAQLIPGRIVLGIGVGADLSGHNLAVGIVENSNVALWLLIAADGADTIQIAVTNRSNYFRGSRAAVCAGAGLFAGFGAGGSSGHFARVPNVLTGQFTDQFIQIDLSLDRAGGLVETEPRVMLSGAGILQAIVVT